MCSANPTGVVLPFGLKVQTPSPYMQFGGTMPQVALDLHRAQQLYDYGARLQFGVRGFPSHLGFGAYHPPGSTDPYFQHYLYKDPRVRYVHEEPKPNHSYIGLIAMAILSARDKKLVLSDIYQWILDNYPYFRTRGPGWRNSIRHNLSLNDCFIKSGRSANGKGHYWAIHPANVEDFQKGDFRRRRAQRRVRRHMGLSVPDDDDSPTPSPSCSRATWEEEEQIEVDDKKDLHTDDEVQVSQSPVSENEEERMSTVVSPAPTVCTSKKRLFDMESLLAPDERMLEKRARAHVLDEHPQTVLMNTERTPEKREYEFSPINSVDEEQESKSSVNSFENDKFSGISDPRIATESTENSLQCNLSKQSSYSVSETASKILHHRFRHFNLPMLVSHRSAFHNTRSGYNWNSISPFLGHYPLLNVKNAQTTVIASQQSNMPQNSEMDEINQEETTLKRNTTTKLIE